MRVNDFTRVDAQKAGGRESNLRPVVSVVVKTFFRSRDRDRYLGLQV